MFAGVSEGCATYTSDAFLILKMKTCRIFSFPGVEKQGAASRSDALSVFVQVDQEQRFRYCCVNFCILHRTDCQLQFLL